MRFKASPQLPGAERTRAWHHYGSHMPTNKSTGSVKNKNIVLRLFRSLEYVLDSKSKFLRKIQMLSDFTPLLPLHQVSKE